MRWHEGPPHLALNPPNLFIFCFFWFVVVPFLSLLCHTKKKPCFPPRKGHYLFIFECLPLLLLSFFWPPPFSIFLSLSLSSSCPFSFPSCLYFLLYFASLFLSLSFLFFLLCFCFMKRTTSTYSITKFSFINIFSFWVFCLLFSLKSLFLSLFFLLILSYVFVQHHCFWFHKKNKLKNTNFWSKGGLQQNVFFMNLCFAKCEKLSFFGGHFFGKFWLKFRKHCKIGISALLKKKKIWKNDHFQSQ